MLKHDTKQLSSSSKAETKRRTSVESLTVMFVEVLSFCGEQQEHDGRKKNQSHNKSPQMILKWKRETEIHWEAREEELVKHCDGLCARI